MFERFNMAEVRTITTPFKAHFRSSSSQCLSSQEEGDEMSRVLYASVVVSLMYIMDALSLT